MDSKRARLTGLREQIETALQEKAWLFPEVGKVQGFLGTGEPMFVAERPSTGNFGGPSDRLLYELLEKLRLGNSHLTDVIKSRGKVRDPYPEDMRFHKQVFDEELKIVRPCTIIAFGQKVYDLLQFALAGSGIKIRQVYHYAYARRGAKKAALFERQLRAALSEASEKDKRKGSRLKTHSSRRAPVRNW